MKVILGIDIGTSSCKAIAFGKDLKILGEASSKYETIFPDNYKFEQNPEDWWIASVESIKKLISDSIFTPKDIVGIGISSQAPSIVPIGSNGMPLRNAFLYSDTRGFEDFQEIKSSISEKEIIKTTGNKLDPFFSLSKIFWMKKHEPALYQKTHIFLPANSYINFKLTGVCSIDASTASIFQLMDISKNIWSKNICFKLGLDMKKLPDIFFGGEVIGNTNSNTESETGLPCGVPVIACSHDGAASALSTGVNRPGIVAEMNGTTTVLFAYLKKLNINTKFILSSHVLKDSYLFLSAINATGGSLSWFRDCFYKKTKSMASKKIDDGIYKSIAEEAALSTSGSNGLIFLPYIYGERSPIWDPFARGVFFGINRNSSKGDFIKSIYEGTSFALKHNIQTLENNGVEVKEIRSVGGLTKNKAWNQVKADILGKPILVPDKPVGAPLGNAMMVGYALNLFDDLDYIVKNKIKIKDTYYPDFKNFKFYEKLFKVYRDLYSNVKDNFRELYNIYNQ
jgi:xylulokinase